MCLLVSQNWLTWLCNLDQAWSQAFLDHISLGEGMTLFLIYCVGPLRRVCELASGLTRNQMPSNGLRVRIRCPPLASLYYCVAFRSDGTLCLEAGKSYLLVSSGGEWLSVRSITRGSREVRSLIRRDALPASKSSMRPPTTSARHPQRSAGGVSSLPWPIL